MVLCIMHGFGTKGVFTYAKSTPSLMQIDQRLEEEIKTGPSELNLLAYLWVVGEKQVRSVSTGQMKAKRALTLKKYVQLAFINSNEVKQVRQQMLTVGGTKLINNSRFLPTIDSTTRRLLVNFRIQSIIKKSSGNYLRALPDFDYAEFAKQAMQCKVVKDSNEMRSAIAHVFWITDDRVII